MFRCTECHTTSLKWQGKCPNCGSWNTLVEDDAPSAKKRSAGAKKETFSILENSEEQKRLELQSSELNTVLGGGIVPGSLILLSGEPGIGKSTLSLQIADWFAQAGRSTLYASGEENLFQLSDRANRIGIRNPGIHILNSGAFEDILETAATDASELIILDSVSVLSSLESTSAPGSIATIRHIAEVCMEFAKRTKKAIILIGHVTKDGTISGPKVLEHLVDTVLFLEGSKYEDYRILRSLKNRFGPTDEIGLFRMTETGLSDIANPGLEFVESDEARLPGSALGITMEGSRPLVIEIEALTTYTKFGYPKRSSRGIPSGKLDLLLAVLSKFTDLKLESYDVYTNVGRGLSIAEPGIDLATVAAIISSKKGKSLGQRIFLGEVSLTGVVKHVFNLQRRVDEAIKLGFTEIIVPEKANLKTKADGVTFFRVKNVGEVEKIL